MRSHGCSWFRTVRFWPNTPGTVRIYCTYVSCMTQKVNQWMDFVFFSKMNLWHEDILFSPLFRMLMFVLHYTCRYPVELYNYKTLFVKVCLSTAVFQSFDFTEYPFYLLLWSKLIFHMCINYILHWIILCILITSLVCSGYFIFSFDMHSQSSTFQVAFNILPEAPWGPVK